MFVNIFGAGGCGRELYAFLKRKKGYEVDAFVDIKSGYKLYNIPVVSHEEYDPTLPAIVAIGNPHIREKEVKKILKRYPSTRFPSIIDNTVVFMDKDTIKIGGGCIIYPGVVLTCDISIGNFVHLNINTTIGHDAKIEDYFTATHSVNIAGKVTIGKCVYMGASTTCIDNIKITDNIKTGAGTVIEKDLNESGTYVGVPSRRIK